MATTKKKRRFDAAFKLRVVEYNKIQIEVLVASPYYGMKILVAAASDRANTGR